MSRRSDSSAVAAAAAASEAARVLQARQQESRQENKPEPEPPKRETLHARREEKPEPEVRKPEKKREPVQREPSHREQVMAQIREARGEKEPEEAPKVEASQVEAPKVEAPEPPKVETPEPTPPAVEPEPETVKVKIDGEEYDVPKAEIDEAGGVGPYRILKAAENRLRKASETLAEAKRMAAQQQPPTPPKPTDKEVLAKLAAARFGTDEEYAAALEEALSRGRVDPNALTQRALAEFEHTMAVREFDQNFSDVMRNPIGAHAVLGLRAQAIAQAQRNNQPIDWKNLYSTIGTQVRNALGGARPSQPPAPSAAAATTAATQPSNPSPVSEKEARKASIVTLPTAAARAAAPEEPKPETREESLNRMRARRGLPTV